MNKLLKVSILFGIIGLMMACNSSSQQEKQGKSDAENQDLPLVEVKIERLDPQFFTAKTKEEVKNFLNQQSAIRKVYFPEQDFGTNDQLATNLFRLLKDKNLQAFYTQEQQTFANISDLKQNFETAFAHLKAYDATFKVPRICTMFTGFTGGDLYVSDSLIVIGLDYFMGPKAKFRPQVYDYQLRRYQREYIVPQIMLLLSTKYNETNYADQTLLAEMLYYGKGFEFVHQMIPSAADSLLVTYTTQQLAECAVAQDLVWGHFVDNQLFYKTDHFTKAKYIGEAPSVPAIGPRCPGSIGRWVGWQIVRKYLENNPDISLKALMLNKNAQQMLEQSKYRGQVEE